MAADSNQGEVTLRGQDSAPNLPRYSLLWNLLNVKCSLPTEVLPGHLLRRPTEEELESIRLALKRESEMQDRRVPYEGRATDVGGGRFQWEPAEKSEWRYFVVEDAGGHSFQYVDEGMIALEKASLLSPVELRFGTTFYGTAGLHVRATMTDDQFMSLYTGGRHGQDFESSTVQVIRDNHQMIGSVSVQYPDIGRAVDMFHQLRMLDRFGEFRVLGAFAIIELLVTHKQKLGYDSLTHQIRTKIELVSRRMTEPIDYSGFGALAPSKVWSLLYDCRSRIAHGGSLSFSKDLKALRNIGFVRDFLHTVTKKMLLHALREPALVHDLRAC